MHYGFPFVYSVRVLFCHYVMLLKTLCHFFCLGAVTMSYILSILYLVSVVLILCVVAMFNSRGHKGRMQKLMVFLNLCAQFKLFKQVTPLVSSKKKLILFEEYYHVMLSVVIICCFNKTLQHDIPLF